MKTQIYCFTRTFLSHPSSGPWKSWGESTGSLAQRAGGEEGGAGKPRRGLHSPADPGHLSFLELKDDERAVLKRQVQRAAARTADPTREHKPGVARNTQTRVSPVSASGNVLMSPRLGRVRRHQTGNELSLFSKASPQNAVLQGPVPGLVLGEYVLALAQLLAQVGHLLAQRRVLLLQEGRADGDLVLLQPPRVARALGRHVVLPAPGPVLVILLISDRRAKKQGIRFRQG